MSLYGGINFGAQATPPVIEAAPTIATTPAVATPDANPAAVDGEGKAKPAWSAALRFAPTIRKKAPAPVASSSVPHAFKSAFSNVDDSTVGSNGLRTTSQVNRTLPALAAPTISAPPSFHIQATASSSAAQSEPTSAPIRSGRVLKPPSMTLDDDDVNGFRQTAKGKRAAGKKGKGKKKEEPVLTFNDALYEPSKPCDYSAYKAHLQAMRAQRRLEREEERRRARSPTVSSDEESSAEENSGDEKQQASKKARLFAPPTSYDSVPPSADVPFSIAAPPPTGPNPLAVSRNETGEEAYLRRAGLSAAPKALVAAAATQPSYPQFTSGSTASAGPSQPAYPTFTAASTSSGPSFISYIPPTATSSATPPPPPPAFTPPIIGSFLPSDPFPPFRPPPPSDFPPFRPPQAESSGSAPPNAVLTDAAARARDIAQRLGKLAAFQPPQPPPPTEAMIMASAMESQEIDNRPFAERLMTKFGWKEGQGLGASESGILSALSVAKPSSAPHPQSKKGKKELAAQAALPSSMSKGRTQIVDGSREARNQEQTLKYGEPSRVVLLTNLCGLEDVDDDLGGEVAEEANKFGVVERCFVYQVPGESRDDEAVRIFLVMSGLAGGWNSVKQFDGRFFGGRVVKARFYDEKTFNSGQHRV